MFLMKLKKNIFSIFPLARQQWIILTNLSGLGIYLQRSSKLRISFLRHFMISAVYCDQPSSLPPFSNISYRRILPPGKGFLSTKVKFEQVCLF